MAKVDSLRFLQYWRNALADGSRVEIPVDKAIHLYQANVDYNNGLLLKEQANFLIDAVEKKLNQAKNRLSKDKPDWEVLKEAAILISPFSVSPDPEYTKYAGETGISYPFWIRAIVDRSGFLRPDEDTFPYIPRVHLEPQVNEAVNFIFSDVDTVDNVFARPFTGDGEWKAYLEYIQQCFVRLTGGSLSAYAIKDHVVDFSVTIVVHETLTAAPDGIIRLYDYLIREKEVPSLLEGLADTTYKKIRPLFSGGDFENMSAGHLGQLSYGFPLSVTQRKTLYHFGSLKSGETLAVNGPPGTGKTTLLQSVVANEVVLSAINGGNPAVIVACSTNNQAVTNIIDSFLSVPQKAGLLYNRWLPGLQGFGLYLPAQSKQVAEEIPFIKRIKGKLTGVHTEKENNSYLMKAEAGYIEKSENYLEQKGLTVLDITRRLQALLKNKQREVQEGIRYWQQYKTVAELIRKLKPKPDNIYSAIDIDENALGHIENNIREIEEKVCDYLDKEPFWVKIFAFLSFVKEKRAMRLKQLFRSCNIDYDAVDFYRTSSIHLFFDEKFKLIAQIKKYSDDWKAWRKKNNIKSNPPLDDEGFKIAEQQKRTYFYDELEMGLKYDLFFLAVHYWEGRWLIATKALILEDRVSKNGKNDARERWRRFSMLSPCFVSTFFMAPKFFTYSKYVKASGSDSIWDTPPLLDFIDLLIVDEAGQVSPEVGAATFALAKKAIVVGDTLQIEPVWNVPAKVDHANLHRYQVITDRNDQASISDLQTKGFLCSACSIMQLAQKSSPYHLFPKMERGMMLTEHRRCFDEIIAYCNRLAYHGLLEPKKGNAKDNLFSPMQFHAVDGISITKNGSSRSNPEEAAAIAKWIQDNAELLLGHYQRREAASAVKDNRPENNISLADILGIVTPFSGQKNELAMALRRGGINAAELTIGTVHALQGAERPVIVFSATYGTNDLGKGYFYDRGVNMLNVAVSRAKDAFLLFGCKDVLSQSTKTPSGQLYHYIKSIAANSN